MPVLSAGLLPASLRNVPPEHVGEREHVLGVAVGGARQTGHCLIDRGERLGFASEQKKQDCPLLLWWPTEARFDGGQNRFHR